MLVLEPGKIRAPRGSGLNCRGWLQEAALRMLMNNLDPEVAELPEELIVYGGTGKAARNWPAFKAIVTELLRLGDDQTLLVQSGKPVGVLPTHPDAPRVILANSNLVGRWANWEHFRQLEERGLIMYGQMTAGSWIYIGTQGILQGTYETFAAAGRTHFGSDDLAGRLIVSGGCGGMSGAQPLAATMAGATYLGAEVDPARAERRVRDRYLDEVETDLAAALARAEDYRRRRVARSVVWIGNIVDLLQALIDKGPTPDILTDQTSAHDPLRGYVPEGLDVAAAAELRRRDPAAYLHRSHATMARHVRQMIRLQERGAATFDYGNNLRGEALAGGGVSSEEVRRPDGAWRYPGFVPAYIRPLFCQGQGPFRWCALSGDPGDIQATDQTLIELFPQKRHLARWLELARERVAFQGLPSRICWLGQGERQAAGLAFNDLVASGRVKAPIVIGRDHLDTGSVASPNRETEGMADGSDAIADWPLLNFALNVAGGASWVSFHHGGGVGMGYSLHAGMVVVADGTAAAARRLARVLHNDPASGVLRHADAGYEEALSTARNHGLHIPMASPGSPEAGQ